MPLGKNLKKKSLIPSEESQKKTTPKKKGGKEKPKKPSETIKATSPKPVPSSKQVREKSSVLRKDELEKRQSLHQQFQEEVESLKKKQVHLIVFKIGGEEFALEIDKVDEVVVTPSITRMPHAPSYIPGLATIRGKGIVTIDLAHKLGLADTNSDFKERTRYTMVINTDRFNVGVLIPEVPYNRIVAGSTIQSASDSVSETALDETYIKGLIRLDDRMIFFMDFDELVEGDRLRARVAN